MFSLSAIHMLLVSVRHSFQVDATRFLIPLIVQHSWAILFDDKPQSVNDF